MSPAKLTNYTHFKFRPRIISIWITESPDPSRIGEHKLFPLPNQHFTIEQQERGHIDGWMGMPRYFIFDEETMDIDTIPNQHMHVSLRAFSRRQIKDIQNFARSIEGLGITPIPITKEKRG